MELILIKMKILTNLLALTFKGSKVDIKIDKVHKQ